MTPNSGWILVVIGILSAVVAIGISVGLAAALGLAALALIILGGIVISDPSSW